VLSPNKKKRAAAATIKTNPKKRRIVFALFSVEAIPFWMSHAVRPVGASCVNWGLDESSSN